MQCQGENPLLINKTLKATAKTVVLYFLSLLLKSPIKILKTILLTLQENVDKKMPKKLFNLEQHVNKHL